MSLKKINVIGIFTQGMLSLKIKDKVIRGIKWSSLATFIVSVLQILQLSILTSFLSTGDFGLMAVVMVVIGFGQIFSDMGVSNAIIHFQDPTDVQLSSLYWLNIASGVFLFVVVAELSPFIANFYSQPELTELITLLASSFIILAVGNQYRRLLQKDLDFDIMAFIQIVAAVVAFLVAIFFAMNDFGVYALVYSTLSSAFVSSGLFLFVGLKKHRPHFIYNYSEIKQYVHFGMFQMGEGALNYFNSQIDVLLIGKLLGVEALGIYSVIKQLVMRPAQVINPIISRVAFPIMAKLQNQDELLKNFYLKIINYLSSVNFPFYFAVTIMAEPIIIIMFGRDFLPGIIVFQVLSIYAAIRATLSPVGSLVMAKGRVKFAFYWNLALFMFIPLAIFCGSRFGINGVAYAILALQVILMIPSWYFLVYRLCEANFKEYFKQIFIPLLLAMIAAFVSFTLFNSIINLYVKVVLMLFIGGGIYIILSYYLNRGFLTAVKSLILQRVI